MRGFNLWTCCSVSLIYRPTVLGEVLEEACYFVSKKKKKNGKVPAHCLEEKPELNEKTIMQGLWNGKLRFNHENGEFLRRVFRNCVFRKYFFSQTRFQPYYNY